MGACSLRGARRAVQARCRDDGDEAMLFRVTQRSMSAAVAAPHLRGAQRDGRAVAQRVHRRAARQPRRLPRVHPVRRQLHPRARPARRHARLVGVCAPRARRLQGPRGAARLLRRAARAAGRRRCSSRRPALNTRPRLGAWLLRRRAGAGRTSLLMLAAATVGAAAIAAIFGCGRGVQPCCRARALARLILAGAAPAPACARRLPPPLRVGRAGRLVRAGALPTGRLRALAACPCAAPPHIRPDPPPPLRSPTASLPRCCPRQTRSRQRRPPAEGPDPDQAQDWCRGPPARHRRDRAPPPPAATLRLPPGRAPRRRPRRQAPSPGPAQSSAARMRRQARRRLPAQRRRRPWQPCRPPPPARLAAAPPCHAAGPQRQAQP